MSLTFRWAEPGDAQVRGFLEARDTAVVARRGELVDALCCPTAVAAEDHAVVGVLTYCVDGTECEILTLHTARQWAGIGTTLVRRVAERAVALGCTRYCVTTTNDNIDALRFYQRRGFRIATLRRGAVDESRRTVKPAIPALGDYGIPLRDEIELDQPLAPQ